MVGHRILGRLVAAAPVVALVVCACVVLPAAEGFKIRLNAASRTFQAGGATPASGTAICETVAQSPPTTLGSNRVPAVLKLEVKSFACEVETNCKKTANDNNAIMQDCLKSATEKTTYLESSYLDYDKYIDDNTKQAAKKYAVEYANAQVTTENWAVFKKLKDKLQDVCEDQYKNCKRESARYAVAFMKSMRPTLAEGFSPAKSESDACPRPDVDPKFIAQYGAVEHHTRLYKHDIRTSCQNNLPNHLDSLQSTYKCLEKEYKAVYRWCCPYWVIMNRKEEGTFDQFFRQDSPFRAIPAPKNSDGSFVEEEATPYGATTGSNERKVLMEKIKDTFDRLCEEKTTEQKDRAFCLGKACTYVADGLYRVLHAIGELIKDAAALGREHPLNNQI